MRWKTQNGFTFFLLLFYWSTVTFLRFAPSFHFAASSVFFFQANLLNCWDVFILWQNEENEGNCDIFAYAVVVSKSGKPVEPFAVSAILLLLVRRNLFKRKLVFQKLRFYFSLLRKDHKDCAELFFVLELTECWNKITKRFCRELVFLFGSLLLIWISHCTCSISGVLISSQKSSNRVLVWSEWLPTRRSSSSESLPRRPNRIGQLIFSLLCHACFFIYDAEK